MPALSVCLAALAALALPAFGEEPPAPAGGGAYGIVLRKQSSGNRVVIQPLEGTFAEGAEIRIHNNMNGKVTCRATVEKVYWNLVYSAAEGCDRFDEIAPGAGVTLDRNIRDMLRVYKSRAAIEEAVREREWSRSPGAPLEIAEEQYEEMVVRSRVPVFLEIYATWCPRCDEFRPVLGEVAKELEGRVRVAIADGEKVPALRKQLGISGYPTLLLFVNGNIVERWAGAYRDKEPVLQRIRRRLPPPGDR